MLKLILGFFFKEAVNLLPFTQMGVNPVRMPFGAPPVKRRGKVSDSGCNSIFSLEKLLLN